MRAIRALIIVMALLLAACGSSSSPQSIPNLSVSTDLKKLDSDRSLTDQEQEYIDEVLAILGNYSSGTEMGGDLLMEASKETSLLRNRAWNDRMVVALALIKANSILARDLTHPERFEDAHQHLLALATQMDQAATLVAEGVDDLDAAKFDQATTKLNAAKQTMNRLSSAIVRAAGTTTQPSPISSAKAKNNANLRSGPGTTYAVAGSATAGQALKIVAKNAAGDWYQLDDGKWIVAFLVDAAPAGLPTAGATMVAPARAPLATVRPAPPVSGAVANKNANLRNGPGTDYDRGGTAEAGQALEIVGRNEAGDWYKLASGLWIAAFLVDNAPANVPVSSSIPSLPERSAPVSPATTQPYAQCDCSGDLFNCADFASPYDAQACFNFCGGVANDVHRLDRDGDGNACEWE